MDFTWLHKNFGEKYLDDRYAVPFLEGEYLYSFNQYRGIRVRNNLVTSPIAKYGDPTQGRNFETLVYFMEQPVIKSVEIDLPLFLKEWKTQAKVAKVNKMFPFLKIEHLVFNPEQIKLLVTLIGKYKVKTMTLRIFSERNGCGAVFDMNGGDLQQFQMPTILLDEEKDEKKVHHVINCPTK
jgi:hypothetical protein